MKTMQIQGLEYIEAKPDETRLGPLGEVCSQCSFGLGRLRACAEALERSSAVFGGDCVERDVIYAPVESVAPKLPQKEEA